MVLYRGYMEIKVSLEAIKESRLIKFEPPKNEIDICPWCSGWWYVNDFPKHNSGCNRL